MAPILSLLSVGLGLLISCPLRVVAQIPSDVPPAQVVQDHAAQVKLQPHSANCDLAASPPLLCANIALALSDRLYRKQEGNFRFWDAQQSEVTPACRVEPSTTEEVALILGILVKESCPFAIRSGGHSRIPNSSNSNGGVTIDMVGIGGIELSKDTKTVKVGSGALWHDVYSRLEEKNLMVVGGRVGDVGVGGLVMGGGISFFSPRYGWALDSVTEYEVVLPNSTIVTASETSHPDLYFALRGGGTNFGIVTYFTIETFPQGLMMGGSKSYTNDKNDALLAAMHKFTTDTEQLDAATYSAFVYYQLYDIFMAVVQQVTATPEMDPPIFDDFKAIEAMGGNLRIDSMSNLTYEIQLASPHGSRNIYSTLSYFPSIELNKKIVGIFQEEAEAIKKVEGIVPGVVIQPLYKNAIRLMKKRGGNALGLDVEGPLTIMSTAQAWKHASDDELMYKFNDKVMERAKAAAIESGLYHPFLYPNYASRDQDVFAGYGKDALKRLKTIQAEIDADGVFQKGGLCDGYFNLLTKQEKAEEPAKKVRDEL